MLHRGRGNAGDAGSTSADPRRFLERRTPLACDPLSLELMGIPDELVALACPEECVPSDGARAVGGIRERALDALQVREDPDLRPYIWEMDECL